MDLFSKRIEMNQPGFDVFPAMKETDNTAYWIKPRLSDQVRALDGEFTTIGLAIAKFNEEFRVVGSRVTYAKFAAERFAEIYKSIGICPAALLKLRRQSRAKRQGKNWRSMR
jgi:hypothetical protein